MIARVDNVPKVANMAMTSGARSRSLGGVIVAVDLVTELSNLWTTQELQDTKIWKEERSLFVLFFPWSFMQIPYCLQYALHYTYATSWTFHACLTRVMLLSLTLECRSVSELGPPVPTGKSMPNAERPANDASVDLQLFRLGRIPIPGTTCKTPPTFQNGTLRT